MAKFRERVEAEFENIEKALAEPPPNNNLFQLSILEIAGVAALIHRIYNGVESAKDVVTFLHKDILG